MPELPEVDTTRAGIAPYVTGQTVRTVIARQPQLRWPVSDSPGACPTAFSTMPYIYGEKDWRVEGDAVKTRTH